MSDPERMYRYRKASPEERANMVAHRRKFGLPLHAPPHYPDGKKRYILSAACFEHTPFMVMPGRRDAVRAEVIDALIAEPWADVRAWVVLPNHWHVVGCVDLAPFGEWIRVVHSRLAGRWNREDSAKGRRVWFRFQDRAIRNDAHYFASLNYVHANPVKHGCVKRADEWEWSSLRNYLDEHGRERLRGLWKEYPVGDYGKGWDW